MVFFFFFYQLQESKPLFLSLGLLNIYEINRYQLAIFMHSYSNGSLPLGFKNYFVTNDTIHRYNTRSSKKLHVNFQRTNYGRFSVKHKGSETWNNLPILLKEIKAPHTFKREVKKFILNQPNPYEA